VEVKVVVPHDVDPATMTTRWLEGESSILISGHRIKPKVEEELVKAQMDAWMEDAQHVMQEVIQGFVGEHKHEEDNAEKSSEKLKVHSVSLDVSGYHPDEVSVLHKENKVTVTGYHAHQDGGEMEEMRFKKSFTFPADADLSKITWKINTDTNTMQVSAPLSSH
jgi:HSP20 family molecular chaperone IbpA